MYNVFVPIYNRKLNDNQKEKLLFQLNRLKPQIVLLTWSRIMNDDNKKAERNELFYENKKFLEEAGFTVGAWLAPTIGYSKDSSPIDNNAPFTKIKTSKGNVLNGAFCPLDHRFTDELCNNIKDIASTGVSTILFEDDFTLTAGKFPPNEGFCCCCDFHMAKYREMLGEDIEIEDLNDLIYNHGNNKYRKAWLELQGETLKQLCQMLEEAAHSINPEVRIGLSANSGSYSVEGIMLPELARTIAGNTKPFIRLTGAPYWRRFPIFAPNIDAIRLQTAWCGEGIDLIAEGDTFPRPRYWVPSSLLEAYDMILRADGKTNGILKYIIDYNSDADYETGYIDRHILNRDIYQEIEERFSKGNTEGLYVFENPELFRNLDLNEDCPCTNNGHAGYLPLVSQWFTADNSIPCTYQRGSGASLVFGENAKYVDEEMLNNGVILDAHAAKILTEKGIDVGIKAFDRIESPSVEVFVEYNEQIMVTTENKSVFYEFSLNESAKVISEFYNMPIELGLIPSSEVLKSFKHFPACYLYENAKGQRFMVYSFTALLATVPAAGWVTGVFRSYCRQKQLTEGINWLQKKPLPAICLKNPELYILCKRNGDSLTVGIWNLFPDAVLEPKILLDSEYSSVDFYRCSGKLEANLLKLSDKISPYDFVCFTVKK